MFIKPKNHKCAGEGERQFPNISKCWPFEINEWTKPQTISNPQPSKPYSYGDHKSKRNKFSDGSFSKWLRYTDQTRPQISVIDMQGIRGNI